MKKAILFTGLVLALGAVAWWYVLGSDVPSNNSTVSIPTKDDSPSKQPAKPEKYLVIKEWNVRFKLSKGIEDAKVVYQNGRPQGITTREALDIPICKSSALRVINRAQKGQQITPGQTVDDWLKRDGDSLVKIGSYYYVMFNGGWTCGSTDKQKKHFYNIERELSDAFYKTLERAN